MQLNHIDLTVPDVAVVSSFFQAHFHFTLLETRGNNGMAVLQGDGNFILVLTRNTTEHQSSYPDRFHIGFLLDSEQAVSTAYFNMIAAGVEVPSPPKKMHNRFTFYVRLLDSILIEIGH